MRGEPRTDPLSELTGQWRDRQIGSLEQRMRRSRSLVNTVSAYLALDFFDHVIVARGHDGLDLVAKLQRPRELVE